MEAIFLEGKSIYLRLPCKEDLPLLLRWINDQEILKYIVNYLPMSEEAESKWIEKTTSNLREEITFVIVLKRTNESNISERRDQKVRLTDMPIGTLGLHKINWRNLTAETGALIGEKEYWGKGYGTEAKMLLLNYCFNTLGLHKICSSAISYNKRSIAYQKKTGAVVEGKRKKQLFRDGDYHDEILLAIFADTWRKIWKKEKSKYLKVTE
ncbi:GNAT family N-acetyltransferase [Candidatus Nomurabacteria bacterium]|nr:GNAT family N-acetyltransferase [Candidatus Nomurabacteria bacterium]